MYSIDVNHITYRKKNQGSICHKHAPPGGNFSIICELCLPDWWDRTQPDAVIELIYLPRVDLLYWISCEDY